MKEKWASRWTHENVDQLFRISRCSHFVLCYCIDIWLFGWGKPFFNQPRLLHQSKATADSLHTGVIFFFFNWGRVSVIIAISPSFPCISLSFGTHGWSFSDGTTHLTCSWRGCCEAHCVLVLVSFTPLQGDTAGIQESWSQRCYTCLLLPWEHQGHWYPKTQSNISNTCLADLPLLSS